MEEVRNRFCSNQELVCLLFMTIFFLVLFFRFWCCLKCVCKHLLCWSYTGRMGWGGAFPFQLTRRFVIFKLHLFKYVQRSRTNSYIYVEYLKSDCMRVSYSKTQFYCIFFFNKLSTKTKMHILHDFFSHLIIVLGFGGTFRYFFLSILVIMYGKPWDTHRLSSSVYSLIPNNLVQEEHIYRININTNGKKYTNTVM